jgi:hypothetical protein
MRYFKFNHTEPCDPDDLRAKPEYKAVSSKEERLLRWKSRLSALAGWAVFFIVFIGFIAWVQLFEPFSEGKVWLFFNAVLRGVWIVCGTVVAAVLGILASLPFLPKSDGAAFHLKPIHASRRCEALRAYYGLTEPCLVTKCFDATDGQFINHDVCLFVADHELRLTTNLKNGVFAGDKDLGCYAFTREEITVSSVEREHYTVAELTAEGMTFCLGIRAERFIRNHFLDSETTEALTQRDTL